MLDPVNPLTTAGKSSFFFLPGFSFIKLRQALAVLASFFAARFSDLFRITLLPKHLVEESLYVARRLNRTPPDPPNGWKLQMM